MNTQCKQWMRTAKPEYESGKIKALAGKNPASPIDMPEVAFLENDEQ